MRNNELNILFEKYLEGKCSLEEERQVLDWYNTLQIPESQNNLTEQEREMVGAKIWDKLENETLKLTKPKFSIQKNYLTIAASILLLISVFLIGYKINTNDTFIASNSDIEVKNTSNKPQEVILEDGSIVLLNPSSKLSYPEHFGEKIRKVYLTGEAKFDVKRNPNVPFHVVTDGIVTEVLGTSFIIKSYDKQKSIEVEVISGKVAVYENSTQKDKFKKGAVLTPNQKISYDVVSKELKTSIVVNPVAVEHKKNVFVFTDTPLPKVLEMFKQSYQLDFFLENSNLSQCVFTADLNELPMFTQLDLLCKSINAQYEVRGTDIFITGEGCYSK